MIIVSSMVRSPTPMARVTKVQSKVEQKMARGSMFLRKEIGMKAISRMISSTALDNLNKRMGPPIRVPSKWGFSMEKGI